jgi:ABC-2 type transport system permease protein
MHLKNGILRFHNWIQRLPRYRFLFEELVKRDFKMKYKRTILGMGWSILSPLISLFVMRLVFTQFFGRNTPYYTTYLFAGNLLYAFFRDSTSGGMVALMKNADIFTKVNVPKYMFLLSRNVSSVINFGLTLVLFFLFAALDGITFTWRFVFLLYPVVTLLIFNIGIGLILSALYVFFRDTQYLYEIFTQLLMYMSAIFYKVDVYPMYVQRLFLLNPLFCYIKYVRTIVIDGSVPSLAFHGLLLLYAVIALIVGSVIYKRKNHAFLYYV